MKNPNKFRGQLPTVTSPPSRRAMSPRSKRDREVRRRPNPLSPNLGLEEEPRDLPLHPSHIGPLLSLNRHASQSNPHQVLHHLNRKRILQSSIHPLANPHPPPFHQIRLRRRLRPFFLQSRFPEHIPSHLNQRSTLILLAYRIEL
ncbi:hypothetical protein M5K25_017168 [Dendrobium thyrsiflorum]|uniref:Uncharacterized protein n=1 Tax=Dendrobium thyrsiflorum TaxID=117978 RepID=A0ABD0ULR2_DENTH